MESFKKNLLKIEQPLSFAAREDFRNLSQIRGADFGDTACRQKYF